MCNHIKANGEKCKKKSKDDYCYMHKSSYSFDDSKRLIILQNIINAQKQSSLEEANKYIRLLNKHNNLVKISNNNVEIHKNLEERHDKLIELYARVEKDLIEAINVNIKNEKLYNATKNEVKNMNKTLEKKALIIKYKEEEINVLMKINKELEEHAKNYKFIKEFEKEKQDLINKGINIYNYQNNEWHQKRYLRNNLAHAIY